MGYLLDVDGISRIRNFTGVTFTSVLSDAQINYYIDNTEALVMKKCGIQFYDTTVTEWYDGDGTDTITLDKWPLREISEIEIDGTTLNSGNCYFVYWDQSLIRLETGYFTSDYHNIKITYTYGAPSVADPLVFRMARSIAFNSVCKTVLLDEGVRASKGFVSEKMEQYSLSYGKGPYALTLQQLDKEIREAYDVLGISVEAEVV